MNRASKKQSYHPWIRARDDVSYHHFRLHFFALYLIRGRTGRWEGGGKEKNKKKKKKRSQPVQAQHQPTPALGHPASQSGGFKKYYQTRQASSLSLNLSGTNSTREQSTVQQKPSLLKQVFYLILFVRPYNVPEQRMSFLSEPPP